MPRPYLMIIAVDNAYDNVGSSVGVVDIHGVVQSHTNTCGVFLTQIYSHVDSKSQNTRNIYINTKYYKTLFGKASWDEVTCTCVIQDFTMCV